MNPEPDKSRTIYTVGAFTRLVKGLMEQAFGSVWVEGEISNLRRPPSGHSYFTLKDADAQLRTVMWKSDLQRLRTSLHDGLRVRVWGQVTVYERDGQYQLVARQIEESGQGDLQAAFEALKRKLEAEGLFKPERKRPLPMLPRHIGIVTSPSGAAIRDILNILGRRYPNLHVVIAPARVQGGGAAEEIAAAIALLNRRPELEVLIVGRGGGSIEDLWAFNEEVVARAIAGSAIPVISAVGHETDFTIADFVADLRAPTPSAAAELVVGCKQAFEETLAAQAARLTRAARHGVLTARMRYNRTAGHYVFREPGNAARLYRTRLAALMERARHALTGALQAHQQRLDDLALRMVHRSTLATTTAAQRLRLAERQLTAYNPLAVLARGYSVTTLLDGRVVRSAAEAPPGTRVHNRLASGSIESEVKSSYDEKGHG
ncbi:MAG: exodeoxyribonuclease VII large subunit [bacterium]